MPQVIVKDTLINYLDNGKKKPVLICLHGWMHDTNSFKNLTDELKNEFRVISLDLPNFGASQINKNIISIDDYAEFLKLFIAKLGIDKYSIAGHSMGGQIAIRAVAQEKINPEKLILIAAAGIRDNRRAYKLFLKLISKLVKYIIPVRIKNYLYKAIGSDYNADLSDVHKEIIGKTLTTDILSDAKELRLPVLLIFGSLDKSTPLWMGEKLHSVIKGSILEIVDGENHWLHQTSAQKVAQFIIGFDK